MKHRIVLTLVMSLTFFFGLSQTPLFTRFKDVVVETDLTKQKADFLKQHKKEYGYNKSQFETWIDGKTYIVAMKKGEYSLFTTDGKPLLTHGNNVKWFPAIAVEPHKGASIYMLFNQKASYSQKGIASDLYGIVVLPEDSPGSVYEIFEDGGEVFIKTSNVNLSDWPKLGGLYSIRFGKIFNRDEWGKSFALNKEMKEGVDSIIIDGASAGFWHGLRKPTAVGIMYGKYDGDFGYHSAFITPDRSITHHYKAYYSDFVPGYGILTPSDNVRFMGENNGAFASVTASLDYPTSKMTLVTTDGEILLDSISDVTAIGFPGLFSYHKVVGDRIFGGLIDLCNRENDIPPLFSEVVVEADNESWKPMIRTTLLSDLEKYDPTKKYEQRFDGRLAHYLEYASVDSILKAATRVDIDSLSQPDLIALSRGILRKYADYASSQQRLISHYSGSGEIITDDNMGKFFKAFYKGINPKDFSKESTLMRKVLDTLRKYDEDMADVFELNNDILLGDLILNRDSIIPILKEQYEERSRIVTENHNAIMERAERQRIEIEQKRQADQAARIQAWADAARQWANAYNAKQTKSSKSARSVTGKGKLPAKSGVTQTAGKTDNIDRKGFLKIQIIEWKNKLNKAENAYRQSLNSGGDDWRKKRVIESKRNVVNECLEMIRQFESELNSL